MRMYNQHSASNRSRDQHDHYSSENYPDNRSVYNPPGQHTNRYNNQMQNREWDEGNHFHTGPQKRGALHEPNRYSNSYENHYHEHYGSDPNSAYRNPNTLNYGDDYSTRQQRNRNAGGSAYGSRYDRPSVNENANYEGPGTRSRYKETDYRYGSGQHNWYLEGRYSHENPDRDYDDRHPAHRHEHRGFFDRLGDKIDNAWHSLSGHEHDNDYHNNDKYNDRTYRRHQHHEEERRFNKGYESGPGWADEHTTIDPYKHRSNADTRRSYNNRHNNW